MKKILCPIFFTLLLAACSHTSTTSDQENDGLTTFLSESELQEAGTTERIVNFTIDSWKYIDPHHIVIETKNDDQYLISLRNDCRQLRYELAIGTTSTTGSLTKFDKIIYHENALGRQDCFIDNITKLQPVGGESQ